MGDAISRWKFGVESARRGADWRDILGPEFLLFGDRQPHPPSSPYVRHSARLLATTKMSTAATNFNAEEADNFEDVRAP
jgi:hypothetical protein